MTASYVAQQMDHLLQESNANMDQFEYRLSNQVVRCIVEADSRGHKDAAIQGSNQMLAAAIIRIQQLEQQIEEIKERAA